MKDQIDLLIDENKALEMELFPEYFGIQEEEISEEEDKNVA